MTQYVMAIDQGTTSSRAILFDHDGTVVSTGQMEHEQIFPHAGWVEHDPKEIWDNTREVIGQALSRANVTRHNVEAIGITNQRETTVVWDKNTGEAVYNAIVWQDTRTQKIVNELAEDGGTERFKETTGLPLATYFAGTKVKWILDNVDGARERAEAGDLLFGTTDTWVLWNLTGGTDAGVHVTDVTNASRTLFMDLASRTWDEDILEVFGVPTSMLPEIKSSSEVYGHAHSESLLRETPIAGILGDQQAATFGQAAFDRGGAKNTYGTGNFLIVNTGHEIVKSIAGSSPRSRISSAMTSPTTRWRDRSPTPAPSCRGCATIWASSPRPRRSSSWRSPSRTTAAPTSFRRSRACSHRTGARTHVGPSWASPGTSTRGISLARSWRPRPIRPRRCWTRSIPTRRCR